MTKGIIKTVLITALAIFSISAADSEIETAKKKACKTSCTSHCCQKKSEEIKACGSNAEKKCSATKKKACGTKIDSVFDVEHDNGIYDVVE